MRLYRMSFGGNLPGGDVFDYSVHANFGDTVIPADVLGVMESALTAFLTTASGIQSEFTTTTKWVSLNASQIDPATGAVGLSGVTATNHAGTSSTANPLPGQMSTVVSLRTAGFSKSERGRFYLPALAASSLGANTKIIPATMTKLVTSTSAFFAAIKGNIIPGTPVVFSRVQHTTHDVTRYDIGDRFDVQRDRAKSVPEARSGAAI